MNSVLPLNRRFLCQHRNGDDFLTNPTTDFVTYLQADTVENIKLIAQYEVSTITEASSLAQITALVVGSQVKLTHPFNSWNTEGMVVGNSIRVEANSNTITETIENIVGQDMYISDSGFLSTLSVIDGNSRSDYVVKVLTVPTSLILKFGIIPQTTSAVNYDSLLDGQEQAYSVNGIGATTTLDYLSTPSSNLGSVTAKFDSTGPDGYKHTFTIEHVFRIPHFVAQWLTAYDTGNVPFNFIGSASYKYVSQLNFGVNITNPNDGKIFNDSFQLSSIGFRGQNFNGSASVYSLETTASYTIGILSTTNPEVTASNVVSCQIKKNNGNFTAGVKGFLYHSRATDANDYSFNNNTYDTNFVFEQIFNVDGGPPKTNLGGIISNMTCTINGVDASILDIAFTLSYPVAQQGIIDAGDVLLLQFGIEDGALSATLSDRTIIQLNEGTSNWTKNSDIAGIFTNNQLDITEVGSVTSKSNAATWVNQAYEVEFNFDMLKIADSDDCKLKKLSLAVMARNTSNGEFFYNQIYDIPLFINKVTVVDVDGTGYQAFNIDTTRFLSVPSGDSLREVQLTSVIPGVFSATQNFSGKVGLIFNWQQWIENAEVNNVFYDGALPDEFFGLNRRVSNYNSVNGYDLFIAIIATGEKTGINTDYALLSDKGAVNDFDDDATGQGWVATNTILDNQSQLSTDIYDQKMTIVRTFDMPTAGALDISKLMGTIVIEETGNTGRHWRLHTVLDYSEPDNPLEPEIGETGVKITQDIPGNKIILTCLLDGNMIDLTKNHNIYAHLNNNI